MAGSAITSSGSFAAHTGMYWPNAGRRALVRAAPRDRHDPIRSPHALAVLGGGTIWVVDWLIGGGLTSIAIREIDDGSPAPGRTSPGSGQWPGSRNSRTSRNSTPGPDIAEK